MSGLMDRLPEIWLMLPEALRFIVIVTLKIAALLLPLILGVAYFAY